MFASTSLAAGAHDGEGSSKLTPRETSAVESEHLPILADAGHVEARTAHLQQIVQQYFPDVWRFLRRLGFDEHLVDDAAQDLFLVALRRLGDVTPGRERAFLFGAAVRIASKLKRKHAREVPTESFAREPDTGGHLDDRLDEERARELAYRLLSELHEDLRTVFVLYEFEELTLQEISTILEVPMGTVASRLRRAREDFTARLERHRKRLRALR